jgi:hypothetical protein
MGSPVHDRGAPSERGPATWQIGAVRGYRIYHGNPSARNVSTLTPVSDRKLASGTWPGRNRRLALPDGWHGDTTGISKVDEV